MTRDNRERMRIALFLPDLGIGGAERVFLTLSKQMVRRGIQVDLVLARKSGPLLNEVDPGVNIIDLAAFRTDEPIWRFALRTLSSLIRYLRGSPPDVLLSTLTGANLTAILARLLSMRAFRLVIREAVTLSNVTSGLRLRVMRILYPLSDKVVVLTDFMKKEMVTSLSLSGNKVIVINNPVDSERLKTLAAEFDIRQADGKMNSYAISIGRLVEQKDLVTAIHAVAHINANRPFDFVIIGEGPQKDELQALARTLGISDRVHFMGYMSNPYPWLSQAKVFILSSRWEGYPNVLLEAMSLGCAIVVTEYDHSVRCILSTYPKQLYRIVSVGNGKKMADETIGLLDKDRTKGHLRPNTVQQVVDEYLSVLDVH